MAAITLNSIPTPISVVAVIILAAVMIPAIPQASPVKAKAKILIPAKLIPVMIKRSGIDPEKQVNEVTAEERKRLVDLTKAFSVTLTGLRGYNEAIVTQGGVNVKEVNPSTMESKKLQGLYFAGEVLDLDGVTGGFNLQIAWSTGMLAGRSV